MAKQYDIFISYRRDGGEADARDIRNRLNALGYRVFFDQESLGPVFFNEKLYEIIDNCKDFIVILSPGSLDRCLNEGDWVRLEIARAFEKGKNVIPVMLRKFNFPDPEMLPEDIRAICYRQAIGASTEFFDATIDKLCKFMTSKRMASYHLKRIVPYVTAALAVALVVTAVVFWRAVSLPKEESVLPYGDTEQTSPAGTDPKVNTTEDDTVESMVENASKPDCDKVDEETEAFNFDIETIKYSNGLTYIGELHEGEIYGYGILFSPSMALEGIWMDFEWDSSEFIDMTFCGYTVVESDDTDTLAFRTLCLNGEEVYDEEDDDLHIYKKAPEFEIVEYDDGGVYIGEIENGYKNGIGKMFYPNGDYYVGRWSEEHADGFGYYVFNEGDTYFGFFKNSLKSEYGVYAWKNGDVYRGEWNNGVKSGRGTLTFSNGDVYDGEFVNDKCEGHGIYTFADGDVYEGEFANDNFEGHGICTFGEGSDYNGDIYDGEFVNGKKEGYGTYVYANGDVYCGEWLDDKKEGHGIYTYKNGAVFDGEWVNDKMEGHGIYTYVDGTVYDVEFENGELISSTIIED